MLELINGRGQLGSCLKYQMEKFLDKNNNSEYAEKINNSVIYHTWNLQDKSKETQKKEFEKFKKFVDKNKNKRIVFISTLNDNWDYYKEYKTKAELYVLENNQDSLIIKLPSLIGKGGIFDRCLVGKQPYFGEIEIETINGATIKILNCLKSTKQIISIGGSKIDAWCIYELIKLGQYNANKFPK